jgi:hypothetical protein
MRKLLADAEPDCRDNEGDSTAFSRAIVKTLTRADALLGE